MAGKQKGKKTVAVTVFAKTYNECNGNAVEVAKVLGMTVGNVYTRANNLRKQGVKLHETSGRKPLDVEALNALLVGSDSNQSTKQVAE